MKKLLTLSLLSLSFYSVSDGHPEGAFNTLFVKLSKIIVAFANFSVPNNLI